MQIQKFVVGLGFLLLALTGCKESENVVVEEAWEQSPLFEAGSYTMLGVKDTIGFIYEENELSRFYPNKEQKYMWHIWFGDRQQGAFTVKATHQEKKEERLLIDAQSFGGPQNGADAHLPSILSLPTSGLWKLDTYLDDVLFETLYVNVHEKSD